MLKLSPIKKRRFSQHFMVAGIRQGLSNNNILDQLQAVGLGYRRGVFLQDIKRLRQFKPRQPAMSRQEMTTYLSTNRTLGMLSRGRTKYQYVFKVPFRDPTTGKIVERRNISFISSREMIPDVAFQLMENISLIRDSNINVPDYSKVKKLTQVIWRNAQESLE